MSGCKRNRPHLRVGVVGLGKLGLPLAVLLADTGFPVLGIDNDEERVREIAAGNALFHEPGLNEALGRVLGRGLQLGTDAAEAGRCRNVSFVLTPTPSEDSGAFSSVLVDRAVAEIASGIAAREASGHVIVVASTVMPGTHEKTLIPTVKQATGQSAGESWSICYAPEFVALGDVMRGYREPDLVLIGESDTLAGETVASIYTCLCRNEPPIIRTSIINAELAKVALNTYVTVKIEYANFLTRLCETMPGADVDTVTRIIGCDSRIGPKYLRGGQAFGGPCFPRDIRALKILARDCGVPSWLLDAVERGNLAEAKRLAAGTMALIGNTASAQAAILGLAFKPGTALTTHSPALSLAQSLRQEGVRVCAYDRLLSGNEEDCRTAGIESRSSVSRCLEDSDLCILMHRDLELAEELEMVSLTRPVVLIDCWRIVRPGRLDPLFTYRCLGRGR